MAYEELNKLKWTGKLACCSVVIRHRGAPNDEKLILGRQITETKKTYFLYREEGRDMETHIPMHRVLRVMLGEKTIWEKGRRQKRP